MSLSFDAMADRFDDQRGVPVEAIQALAGFFTGPTLDMVEPGIGTGRIALPFAAAGHRVTGVDRSRPMLAACRANAEALGLADRVTLLEGDATALLFPGDRFDAGVIASLLYLVPDWERVLDELDRVIRPGGRVLFVRERTEEGEALRQWSATWREMVEATGFRHASFAPTDAEVIAAMTQRWGAVTTHTLASWPFGQTVAEAREGYGERLRPLYGTVEPATWDVTVAEFLDWTESAFGGPGAGLGGRVHFEIVEATTRQPQRSVISAGRP